MSDVDWSTELGFRIGHAAGHAGSWPDIEKEVISTRLPLLQVENNDSYWQLSRGWVLIVTPGLVPTEADVYVREQIP